MDKEHLYLQIKNNILENLKKVWYMGKENLQLLTDKLLKVNGIKDT